MARWRSRNRVRSRFPILRLSIALLLAASGFTAADAHADLEFSRRGLSVGSKSLEELKTVSPPRSIRVFDPYEEREIEFEALELKSVLDALYSPSWRKEEEILFTCRDGYQPTLPVQRALNHDPWLAFRRVGRDEFSIGKLESGSRKRIDLVPFYLVWENLDDESIRLEADYGWPYQLVGIDLIRASDRFPKMSPPGDASPDVLAGFTAFRVQCSRCHAINGEGGTIGPDLNVPVSPVEVREPEWLRRWIDDPSKILPTARMPGLNRSLADREQTIDQIIDYLRVMAANRERDPTSEGTPNGR